MLAASPIAHPLAQPRLSAGPASRLRPQPTAETLQYLLGHFAPISLGEMEAVALQNRTDTKYLLSTTQLKAALVMLSNEYRIMTIDAVRCHPYQTLYFDTPDFAFYMQHHASKGNRIKVRSRRYLVTDQAFLEVKQKTNKARTIKRRIATEAMALTYTPAVAAFASDGLSQPLPPLIPRLSNRFTRITLVSTCRPERLTIDLDLAFGADGRKIILPGIAVAEVKQAGLDRNSGFVQQLHAAGIGPTGFSKYCIGVALLYPQIKHNRFKPRLRLVQKLIGGYEHV